MPFDKENPEALLLVQTFEKRNVAYIIVGGFAVNRYGYNRSTGDLDILLKDTTANRANLISALADMGYGQFDVLMTTPIIAGYCEILMDDGMYADLMTEIPGLDKDKFDEYYAMATKDLIDGYSIRFLHYNHLIQNKTATGRTKDKLDIEELNRIKQNE
ncbi:hypothetical protein HDF18_10515 [Mucilaginibacter sp. X5P1]|uniref:hypothetical protein n=1 Tax=Mucilaginibacter sp. X5P1 TaxID=2723088 RepID=UPI00161FB3CC|nr:hypothetical protein [Mucilaginibacter sp. X5P1]MBB6140746.1 hypothetical protein [Mucilaginibacter sp. X5P1]